MLREPLIRLRKDMKEHLLLVLVVTGAAVAGWLIFMALILVLRLFA